MRLVDRRPVLPYSTRLPAHLTGQREGKWRRRSGKQPREIGTNGQRWRGSGACTCARARFHCCSEASAEWMKDRMFFEGGKLEEAKEEEGVEVDDLNGDSYLIRLNWPPGWLPH
uniref:Uncharacterized protein n=1 Tax=Caenorhabditis japonica TaxID=281687 RepID=A0A8R1ED23_CAEJA